MNKKHITQFYEHLQYPTLDDEKQLFAMFPIIRQIKIEEFPEIDKHFTDIKKWIDYDDFDHWLMRYKTRLRDIRMTYLFLSYSHHKGIPDDKWSEERKDGKVIFFGDFTRDEHYVNRFLFNYYAEYFFYHIFSSYDILHQCINKLYSLNFDASKNDFNSKILSEIKERNKILFKAMRDFFIQTKSLRRIRNTFTHSFPVNQVDLRSKANRASNTITIGGSSYTTSNELLAQIQQLITQYIPVVKAFEIQIKSSREEQ